MQPLYVVQNVLGVPAVEPIAVDQFIKIEELLDRIPGDQLDHQVALVGDEPSAIGDGGEMPEQQVATRNGEGRRCSAVARSDLEDEERPRIGIMKTREIDHRGLHACSRSFEHLDEFDRVLGTGGLRRQHPRDRILQGAGVASSFFGMQAARPGVAHANANTNTAPAMMES